MFTSKVVLVTGASSGIGLSTAVAFAKEGASLVITGRNIENLKKTAKLCEDVSNKQPLVIAGDLSKEEFIASLVESTIEHYDRLDVLVNNAGYGSYASIENTSLQQLDELYSVNVRAVYYLTMLATPQLIKTKGNIVNVSSIASLRAIPNFVAYSMTKAAIDQFTRCTALDLASKGVRVNCVNPGIVVTEFFNNAGWSLEEQNKEQVLDSMSKKVHPLGRAGRPEEIADAIVFLASDKSSFTTGVTFSIDGGCHVTITN